MYLSAQTELAAFFNELKLRLEIIAEGRRREERGID
jgi:hypothetical protein